MDRPRYPSLYQINSRVWLTERSSVIGRPATLDDVTDAELDELSDRGFDWIWLLSVWQTGSASQRVSRTNQAWRRGFEATLPDLHDDDIGGSGFAITAYHVAEALGGDPALARLRERLAGRGMRLMLDFVPNHTGLDHPWVIDHPDYYVEGTELELMEAPGNFGWVRRPGGDVLLAHGRDPYFPGWPDTLQLDYANPATQAAMIDELVSVSNRCDGVRCDMAMLILPDVFERTWGRRPGPFWPRAIGLVRERKPDFTFMAEVYWDLEWTMLQLGFDYAYDKRLYDRLIAGVAGPVRDHLGAGLDYQSHLARFLENHDEPRAAATFPPDSHEAAAIVTYLTPGLRFFHQGQLDGRRVQISPHLVRAPDEAVDERLAGFYARLLDLLRVQGVRDGDWRLLGVQPAWDGNPTSEDLIAWEWRGPGSSELIVVVNLAAHQSQGFVRLVIDGTAETSVRLEDRWTGVTHERDRDDLGRRGLYVDLPAWGFHLFEATQARDGAAPPPSDARPVPEERQQLSPA
jgi:hypothetical protein